MQNLQLPTPPLFLLDPTSKPLPTILPQLIIHQNQKPQPYSTYSS